MEILAISHETDFCDGTAKHTRQNLSQTRSCAIHDIAQIKRVKGRCSVLMRNDNIIPGLFTLPFNKVSNYKGRPLCYQAA